MTKRRVLQLVRELQVAMSLRDWRVSVDFDQRPEDKKAVASTWRASYYDDAVIYLEANWRSWSDRRARALVAHELGHLITRDLDNAVESVEDELEGSAWNLYYERYIHELEGVVDRYAEIIAGLTA